MPEPRPILRDVLYVQAQGTETRNSRGEVVPSPDWADEEPYIRAQIVPRGSAESRRAGQMVPEATHEIWIRYREGLTAEKRLRKGTRIFNLLGPPQAMPNDVKHWMLLTVKEVVPDG